MSLLSPSPRWAGFGRVPPPQSPPLCAGAAGAPSPSRGVSRVAMGRVTLAGSGGTPGGTPALSEHPPSNAALLVPPRLSPLRPPPSASACLSTRPCVRPALARVSLPSGTSRSPPVTGGPARLVVFVVAPFPAA